MSKIMMMTDAIMINERDDSFGFFRERWSVITLIPYNSGAPEKSGREMSQLDGISCGGTRTKKAGVLR